MVLGIKLRNGALKVPLNLVISRTSEALFCRVRRMTYSSTTSGLTLGADQLTRRVEGPDGSNIKPSGGPEASKQTQKTSMHVYK